jgi:hypothetical protein
LFVPANKREMARKRATVSSVVREPIRPKLGDSARFVFARGRARKDGRKFEIKLPLDYWAEK